MGQISWLCVAVFLFVNQFLFADEKVEMEINGLKRTYILHIPNTKSIVPSKPLPLVLMLHGAGSSAEEEAKSLGWVDKADKEVFVVAFPQGTPLNPKEAANLKTNPNIWDDGAPHNHKENVDDVGFLRTVVQDISKKTPIDADRIFCTGFSNGASMTFRVGIELSDLVAAIAPVSGYLWVKDPKPNRTMSMMLIAGEKDPINPFKGGKGTTLWGKNVEKPAMITSVRSWLHLLNLCEADQNVSEDPGKLSILYGPNSAGKEVIFIILEKQGHAWPGFESDDLPETVTGPNMMDFNATDTIWKFFKFQVKEARLTNRVL